MFSQALERAKQHSTSAGEVTEGKASRNLSHRSKRLYVFPPYNESQSDANEIATRWAHREDVEVGHQRIVSYHGNFYLIEKFDSAELGYQIVDHLTKRHYNEYVKEYENGENISEQSIKEISGEIDSFNREGDWAGRGEHSSSSSPVGQRGENIQVQRVGENKIEGRQDTGNRGGNLRSGITNKQKYSRELDTEYLSAVNRGDMETDQIIANVRRVERRKIFIRLPMLLREKFLTKIAKRLREVLQTKLRISQKARYKLFM